MTPIDLLNAIEQLMDRPYTHGSDEEILETNRLREIMRSLIARERIKYLKPNRKWQLIGDNEWIFGKKVRGFVRDCVIHVYFDEEADLEGAWKWRLGIDPFTNGRAHSLSDAILFSEERLAEEMSERSAKE